MTNKIKTSFDGIHAEDKLKSDTTLYLQKEIARRKKAQRHTIYKRYGVAFASVIVLFMSGIFTYNLYFTPVAYVDVDVNPSIELTLNRFDRVIDSHAYNNDGDDIINGLSLTHKSYEDALVILMESMTKQGYFQDDVLVSVTLQTDNKDKENALLNNIQTDIEGYMTGHHPTAQIDVFPVSSETRSYSHEQGISPAKYLAIQELIEVDPTASIENCRDHSISEIKQLAQEHGNHHNNSDGVDFNVPPTTNDNDSHDDEDTNNGEDSHDDENKDIDDDSQHSEQRSGHDSEDNGNEHREKGH